MLSKRLVPIAFREGIDTKTSKENGVPGRLLELENGVFGKIGEIRKRYGYDALSRNIEGGTALSACDALATYRDELLSFSDGRIYSYSEARTGWLDRGAAQSALVTQTSVVRNTYQQSNPDVAISGSLACVAWEDSRGGVRCRVSDTETGVVLLADAECNAAGTRPYVVAFADHFCVFYAIGNNIFYRRIAIANPRALLGEVNPIATLDPASLAYDVSVIGARLYILWDLVGSGTVAYFNSSMALTTVGSVGSGTSVAVFGDASLNAWCVISNASTQAVAVFDTAGSLLIGPTTIASSSTIGNVSGVVPTNTTTATVALTDTTSHLVAILTVGIDGSVSSPTYVRSVEAIGKAFASGDAVYIPCAHSSTAQATMFVIDTAGNVVARGQAGLAGGYRTRSTLSNVTNATFAATEKTALESVSGALFTRNGVGLISLDLSSSQRFASAEIANNLLFGSGVVNSYDGVTLAEHGFHLFPEGGTGTVSAGGGGLTNGKVYRWRAMYEWTDAHGQVHRSALGTVLVGGSDSYTSAAGNETVTFTLPTLRLTGKSGVRVVLYRTLGNGSIYYRLSPIATPTLNDKTADSVTFVDTMSDATLEGNEIAYTDGAAGSPLDNIAPGPASGIVTHGGRCFLIAGPNKIAASQIVEPGEALAFSDADALFILPDARGGNIVALGSMDDKLVILKDSAIFVTFGDGPDDAGNGGFAKPQLVSSDVGCSEARSVVLTNAGLMFKSAKGIYILDRSLQVTYIGAQVEDFNSLTITSAVMVADQNQVRFTTTGSVIVGTETLSNIALVYDYAFNQWSVFTNCGGVDSVIWRGTYTRASDDGRTYTEDLNGYDDDGDFVKLKLTTSWLSMAGVQGYQRVYRVLPLCDYKSGHTLRVRLGYDFRPEFTFDEEIDAEAVIAPGTWGSGATWGSDSLWGGNAPVEWFVAKPERQKCSAIRVSIEDVQNDTTVGASFSISNLALLVGVKRGTNKLAATRVV